jgi:TRAP-type transport system periplasmic protein
MRLNRLSRRFFVASGATFATIGLVRIPARAAQFSWRCGDGHTGSHPLNTRLQQAFARIRTETKGDLDIKLFPNSLLGGDPAIAQQVRLGALEMIAETGNIFDTVVPAAGIDAVPFAYANYEVAHRAFDGSLGAMIRNEFNAKGLFAFERIYDSGFRDICMSTKPIRTVDDLQGVRLRVPTSKIFVDTFRSLGASPTPVAYAETYSALQTHVVDGAENPLSGMEDLKFYEVQKFVSLSHHQLANFWILVNKEKWTSLPSNFQDIMAKHINAGALLQRNDFGVLERSVRDRLVAHGMIFNDVDINSFRAKLKTSGFYARWRDEFGAPVWRELEKFSGPLA